MEVAVASAVAAAVVATAAATAAAAVVKAADAVVATKVVEGVARNEAVASSTNSAIEGILFISVNFLRNELLFVVFVVVVDFELTSRRSL